MRNGNSYLRRGASVFLAALLCTITTGVRAQTADKPGGYEAIHLTAGRSTILTTEFDVLRIAVTNPAIGDATVVQPREILIDGKTAATISLLWVGSGQM